MTIFINREIARLMELTEVHGVRKYIHVRKEKDSTFDGQILETCGGIAVCTGAESQLNYVVGLGFTDPITTEHLSKIERFFYDKGVAPTFEVCPLADPSLWKTLSQLGYKLQGFTNVWIMSLKERTWMQPTLSNAEVQHVNESDSEMWARTVSSGFLDGAKPTAEDIAFGLGFYHLTGTTAVMVKEKGEAVAGGIVGIENTIADLFFTSTLPTHRGKGYQSALVQERLRIAKAENCKFAMSKTAPGSVSQHTMERAGFQLAYTRFTLSK